MKTTDLVRLQIEAAALADFAQAKGHLFRCGFLCGYTGDDSDDVACDVVVRVTDTDRQFILRWQEPWLDPYWDVDLVHVISGTPPERSYWIDGPSYDMNTGRREWNHVQPISLMQYLRGRLFGFKELATNG